MPDPQQGTLHELGFEAFPDEVSFEIVICDGSAGHRHMHYVAKWGERELIGFQPFSGWFTGANELSTIFDTIAQWVAGTL
jgi:hypothetical protein